MDSWKVVIVTVVAAAVVAVPMAIILTSPPSDTQAASQPTDDKLLVLASFYPIEQFAMQVGGDIVEVKSVLPPGAEPHHWDPTIQDVQNMAHADAIVVNGVGYEAWLVDGFMSADFDGIIIDTSEGVPLLDLAEGTGDHRDPHDDDHHDEHTLSHDPHIWLNPVNAQIQVQNIADRLSALDPDNAEQYRANADAYKRELSQLDDDIETALQGCQREILTFHQAFAYLADRYDLTQYVVLKSTTPHGEVSTRSLEQAIEIANANDITTIFGEETIDPRAVDVVASEIEGGKVMQLSPLENVQDDGTYTEIMYKNLEALKAALCQ